jgi:hypothetical protein
MLHRGVNDDSILSGISTVRDPFLELADGIHEYTEDVNRVYAIPEFLELAMTMREYLAYPGYDCHALPGFLQMAGVMHRYLEYAHQEDHWDPSSHFYNNPSRALQTVFEHMGFHIDEVVIRDMYGLFDRYIVCNIYPTWDWQVLKDENIDLSAFHVRLCRDIPKITSYMSQPVHEYNSGWGIPKWSTTFKDVNGYDTIEEAAVAEIMDIADGYLDYENDFDLWFDPFAIWLREAPYAGTRWVWHQNLTWYPHGYVYVPVWCEDPKAIEWAGRWGPPPQPPHEQVEHYPAFDITVRRNVPRALLLERHLCRVEFDTQLLYDCNCKAKETAGQKLDMWGFPKHHCPRIFPRERGLMSTVELVFWDMSDAWARVQTYENDYDLWDDALVAFNDISDALEGHVSYTPPPYFGHYLDLPAEIRELITEYYLLGESKAGRLSKCQHYDAWEHACCMWEYPDLLVACDSQKYRGFFPDPATGRAPFGWLPSLASTSQQMLGEVTVHMLRNTKKFHLKYVSRTEHFKIAHWFRRFLEAFPDYEGVDAIRCLNFPHAHWFNDSSQQLIFERNPEMDLAAACRRLRRLEMTFHTTKVTMPDPENIYERIPRPILDMVRHWRLHAIFKCKELQEVYFDGIYFRPARGGAPTDLNPLFDLAKWIKKVYLYIHRRNIKVEVGRRWGEWRGYVPGDLVELDEGDMAEVEMWRKTGPSAPGT